MGWTRSIYQAAFSDGTRRSVDGLSNGLFGLSDEFVLTHLATGFKIAQFRTRAGGQRAGDYLRAVYAAEFAAFVEAIEATMSWAQYPSLPSARALNAKVQADETFRTLLAEHGVGDTRRPPPAARR